VGAVNALVAIRQRHIVGVADELDRDILLLTQIVHRLPYVIDECCGHLASRVLIAKRLDQISNTRAPFVPFHEAHLADGLHAAHLETFHFLLDEHLLLDARLLDVVVPHFDFDAPVQSAPSGGGISCNRLRRSGPFV
jgi:hypothetical protein